jgi:hypothetical protein
MHQGDPTTARRTSQVPPNVHDGNATARLSCCSCRGEARSAGALQLLRCMQAVLHGHPRLVPTAKMS